MHANPSTAPTRAPTPKATKDRISDEIIRAYTSASPEMKVKIFTLIQAYCCNEIDIIEAILTDPNTSKEEAEIIRPTLEKLKADIAKARFQPVFTKAQIEKSEADFQAQKDAVRRLGLAVLCMTEKRLQYTANNHFPEYADLVDAVTEFVTNSKEQLELAETAMARLLLVGGEIMGFSK